MDEKMDELNQNEVEMETSEETISEERNSIGAKDVAIVAVVVTVVGLAIKGLYDVGVKVAAKVAAKKANSDGPKKEPFWKRLGKKKTTESDNSDKETETEAKA